jgi:hypothetical protein
MAQLDDAADPGRACGTLRYEQRPQRFGVPVTGLLDHHTTTRQSTAGCSDGVELIALAVLATLTPVGRSTSITGTDGRLK